MRQMPIQSCKERPTLERFRRPVCSTTSPNNTKTKIWSELVRRGRYSRFFQGRARGTSSDQYPNDGYRERKTGRRLESQSWSIEKGACARCAARVDLQKRRKRPPKQYQKTTQCKC